MSKSISSMVSSAGDRSPGRRLALLGPVWLLGEWLRGWLLGGFPWLSLGYSQIDSPLAGFAPLLGLYGASAAVLACAALLVMLLVGRRRLPALLALVLLWGGAALLPRNHWSVPVGEPLRVTVIQGNINQRDKWLRKNLVPTLDLYANLSRRHWSSDLIVWPETAVPAFTWQVEEALLRPLAAEARQQGSALLLGIADGKQGAPDYYNAMMTLGGERAVYHKRHLVPFGEFMPLKPLLGPLIEWLQIPMSDFTPGAAKRPLLQVAGYPAGLSICYEDAFGDEMIEALPTAAFLVNASNDAWFGDSLAMPQHLEIARMRALESNRYLVRATNTGISALIGPDGALLARSPAFERDVLSGEIVPLGERCEICIKGPTLMLGYIGVDTGEVFDSEGYFRTGDGGYVEILDN